MYRLATHERLFPPWRSPPQLALFPATVWDVPLPVKFIFFRDIVLVPINSTPLLVVCWTVPPDPAVVPPPVTVNPPLPAVFKMIPLAGPPAPVPAEMLRKVKPLAPIVV